MVTTEKCISCGGGILPNEERLYSHQSKESICMCCEGKKIDVYKIEHDGNHYFDKDINGIMETIKNADIDDKYAVSKISMLFIKYIRLPDFEGF